jgi:hypothetical protein
MTDPEYFITKGTDNRSKSGNVMTLPVLSSIICIKGHPYVKREETTPGTWRYVKSTSKKAVAEVCAKINPDMYK